MNELLNPQTLIPIVALLIPLAAIIGGLIYRWRREELWHETIRTLVEHGQPIPPELLQHAGRRPATAGDSKPLGDERSLFRRGVVLFAVGSGLALMLSVMAPDSWLWAVGLIPLLVGVGYLVVWKVEGKPGGEHP
jgi:hypothetical protein